jgi:hypothetical protein
MSSNKIAVWLSRIFHPFVIAPLSLFGLAYTAGATLNQALLWMVLAIVITVAPLMAVLVYYKTTGRINNWSVSVREHRYTLYPLTLACFLLFIAVGYWFSAPVVVLACVISAVINTFLYTLINRYWTKISIHAGIISACAASFLFTSLPTALVLFLITPLVSWSRLHLNHHTPTQILLGFVVSISSVFVVFNWLL